jgi:diguanylate cyclase (GGDEF)-like protein
MAMHEVGTNRQALRRMVVMTSISILISVVVTLLAMAYVFGIDPEATIKVSLAFKFGLSIAIAAPFLICPIISYKIVMAVRQRDRAHVELRRLADTDQLTALLNRRGFDAAAEAAISACHLSDLPMSVLMIDIDSFKKLNDSFGHDFGDAALVRVAAILRNSAEAEGFVVGRQGGEEFIALLTGATEAESVVVAERIRWACSQALVEHEGSSAFMTVSIGVSTRRGLSSLSRLVSDADSALYQAKQTGRNRVVFYQPVVSLTRVA